MVAVGFAGEWERDLVSMASGKIVNLTKAHLDEMTKLNLITHNAHVALLPNVFKADRSESDTRKTLERFLPRWLAFDYFGGQGFGWESEGVLCGYLLYTTYENTIDFGLKDSKCAVIWDISVAEGFKKAGVGSALVEELTSRLGREGITEITGQVWNGNDESESFFLKAGFQPVSTNFRLRLKPPTNQA